MAMVMVIHRQPLHHGLAGSMCLLVIKPMAMVTAKASNAQIKYLTSLATEQDIRLSALNAYCQDNYKVDSIYDLSKKEASELVDSLKRHKVKVSA